MSLKEKYGSINKLKVAIVGDILHSRVALSNIYGLIKLGADVMVCGPPHLIQRGIEDLGVKVSYDVDQVIEWADAINILRIQREGKRSQSTSEFLLGSQMKKGIFLSDA